MAHALIDEFLNGDSEEMRDLASNEAALVGCLTLIKGIHDLPNVNTRFYEEPRSLYQVTATGYSVVELMDHLAAFFGSPAKAPGEALPVALRFDPTVKYLNGLRNDQVLFLKRLKTGAFYGALWPWQRDRAKIEILIGFHAAGMSDADTQRMAILVQKFISQKTIQSVNEIGGQIRGISLPSFLQMSEMEGATYALKVTSGERTGHLYLDSGSLIAARYGDFAGEAAAYRIISWDRAAIQIEPADPGRQREIQAPLMHVLMESLKIKDEAEAAPPPPPSKDAPAPASAPEPAPASDEVASPEHAPAPEPEPDLVLELEARAADGLTDVEPMPLPIDGPPPAQDQTDPEPAGKPADRSIGKQAQMSRTAKRLLVLGVVIALVVVATVGGRLLRKHQIDRRYDQLIAELAATNELDVQVVRLMQYIQSHPDDVHRPELEARLSDTTAEIEKRDYAKTIAEVNHLPVDAQYERKALSLYTAFLTKHPESPYAVRIKDAVDGIRQVLSDAAFDDLPGRSTGDFVTRATAYRAFLDQFPQSAHRDAVERMLDDLARDTLRTLQGQRNRCDQEEVWDACITECDRFLAVFAGRDTAPAVEALRREMQDRQALAELRAKAAAVDDPAAAKSIYTAFLATHPATSQKAVIQERIAGLDAELARQAEWQQTAAFAADTTQDIFQRVQRLDAFIDAQGNGPYARAASALREQIEPQRQAAIQAQREQAAQRQAQARRDAQAARQAEEKRRIQRLREQASRQLLPVADRYVDNGDGTVADRFTGLTWSLLDSQMTLNRCLTYREAQTYVRELKTGGSSGWRLPTAGELASLYKNRPYFPDTGAAWYWSAETFARGYHRVVDVVTPLPESTFKRLSKTEDSCGAVRAVR